ncbi:DUF4350 domain-containing protein [Streptomyces sp. NPDC029003]|uniref:DUF4350 domain-containing protein n=1 Tax=Streptomyces sp. NPDC029003 TaxID=3155125 RepID=UPI0033DF30AA
MTPDPTPGTPPAENPHPATPPGEGRRPGTPTPATSSGEGRRPGTPTPATPPGPGAPAPATTPETPSTPAPGAPAPATPPGEGARPGTPAPGTPPGPGMPDPAHPSTPAPASAPGTSADASPARLWARARGILLALGIVLVAAVVLAGLQTGDRHGLLDPRSADPDGTRALAQLLKEHGVTSRVVTNADEAAAATGPGTTLLVSDPDLLGEPQRRAVRSAIELSGGRTVLVAPGSDSLPDLAPAARTQGFAHQRDLDPRPPGSTDCTLPAAATAGRAGTGDGLRYTTGLPGSAACYPSGGHPTVLVLPSTTKGGDTVLLGSASFLRNDRLADQGNASLALQLLGSRPDLVWYLPTLADMASDTGSDEQGLFDLVPAGWAWALLQLFVAAVLAALWRARRLGALVTEDLPVAIRASEATEGRARLYRKAAARDRAATVLRAATRERLAALVGVPAPQAHDPVTLVPAVTARLHPGAGPHDPATTLLFGPTPADDAALVALADHLDALEREVRTS